MIIVIIPLCLTGSHIGFPQDSYYVTEREFGSNTIEIIFCNVILNAFFLTSILRVLQAIQSPLTAAYSIKNSLSIINLNFYLYLSGTAKPVDGTTKVQKTDN
jgi:hypothetical protein